MICCDVSDASNALVLYLIVLQEAVRQRVAAAKSPDVSSCLTGESERILMLFIYDSTTVPGSVSESYLYHLLPHPTYYHTYCRCYLWCSTALVQPLYNRVQRSARTTRLCLYLSVQYLGNPVHPFTKEHDIRCASVQIQTFLEESPPVLTVITTCGRTCTYMIMIPGRDAESLTRLCA